MSSSIVTGTQSSAENVAEFLVPFLWIMNGKKMGGEEWRTGDSMGITRVAKSVQGMSHSMSSLDFSWLTLTRYYLFYFVINMATSSPQRTSKWLGAAVEMQRSILQLIRNIACIQDALKKEKKKPWDSYV